MKHYMFIAQGFDFKSVDVKQNTFKTENVPIPRVKK